MSNFIDKVGDYIRGDREVGKLVDSRANLSGADRRKVIETQKRAYKYSDAFSRFSRSNKSWASDFTGRAKGAYNSSYAPIQMANDISFLREEALKVSSVNPHANRAISVLTNWTIMSGINLTVKAKSKGLQRKVSEVASEFFFKSNDCDSTKHGNYLTIEREVASYFFRAGEVLIRARPRNFADNLAVPVAFEVIDPAQLFDGAKPSGVLDGNSYAAGIEFSPLNHPVAYWLYRSNPKDNLTDRRPVRVPVQDNSGNTQIVHLFDKVFPGQIRGIPRATFVIKTVYEQQDLRYSILRRKRMEAKIGMILKEGVLAQENPTLPGISGSNEDLDNSDRASAADVIDFTEESLLRDNAVVVMPEGWSAEHFMMQNVSDYKEFMADLHRTVATGYGVPYSMITSDLTKVSFSGGKLGLLDFKSERLSDQNYFIQQFHYFCWNQFVLAGNRLGLWNQTKIDVGFRYDAFPSGEPDKDAKVLASRREQGGISMTRYCAEYGEDYFEIVDEIAAEDAYLVSKGLGHLTSEAFYKRVTQRVDPDNANNDNDDEGDGNNDDATDSGN